MTTSGVRSRIAGAVAGAGALSLLLGAAALVAAPAASADQSAATSKGGNPPGNNGTVKIEGVDLQSGPPDNNPHQGCTFVVEFYNFDQGDLNAKVTFEDQAPTADAGLQVVSGDLTPFIGGDPAGGGNDLDARETYTLKFSGEPHPKQGYHVKLTVNAPGSIGNDTKHKVFWVEGCTTTTPPTTPPTTEPTSPSTTEPTSPSTTEPTSPSTTEPTSPSTTEPTSPSTTEPTSPSTTEPTSPSTTEPTSPSTTEPTSPSTTEPTSPSTTEPTSPSTTEPTSPSTTGPTSPSTTEPTSGTPTSTATGTAGVPGPSDSDTPTEGVPTEVDAGLAGGRTVAASNSNPLGTVGTVLMAAGGVMLAAGAAFTLRRRGKHSV
ncbi:hypothetical protein FB561_3875 [Kribbella amoyensis]|uniref:LPXTG-motif cell wall-anchored protein n=1 Tax=Kribbella amoyensis TaxID=996641 RepID=A0A561BV12_9ACTN|nr:hypothetical protein [Kribbella amoyensis]TWD82735.1 hypothetical protein FB561_3875 [Kribbella amoyensis]